MKSPLLLSLFAVSALVAAETNPQADTAEKIEKHKLGSEDAAEKQDTLAGDVQQLRIEQTQPKVVKLLAEVETLMDEASGNLIDYNTGGETLSAQTEIIEKIFEAAKNKQSQGKGESKGSEGMMQMMERMMGKNSEGDEKKEGDKPGKKPGDQPGEGSKGESDTANSINSGVASGTKSEERRVPKAAGTSSAEFPEEFRGALDAYNRATK